MKKTKSLAAALLIVGGIITIFGGAVLTSCTNSNKKAPEFDPSTHTNGPTPSGAMLPDPLPTPTAHGGSASEGKREVTVYRVVTDQDGSRLQPTKVEVSGENDETTAVAALNAMDQYGKDNPLPPGAQAKSVQIDGETATVDFNEALVSKFTGGDENEALVINAVTSILGQFGGVKQVRITVEGKAIDALGGTQSLRAPVPVPQADPNLQTAAQSPSHSGEGH